MKPVIRNFRNVARSGAAAARLIGAADNSPTCAMTFNEFYPGKTSNHHIHPWEHEVYIIKGAGTYICDGKEYPVKEGDGVFVPPGVDHYLLNNGGQGVIRRIEINPLRSLQGGAKPGGSEPGTGKPPHIRNYRDLAQSGRNRLVGKPDGALNYIMLYHNMAPKSESHQHSHAWEHLVFILEGHGTLFCDGEEYLVSEGDVVLVPPGSTHQWRIKDDHPMRRVTFNPIAADAHE